MTDPTFDNFKKHKPREHQAMLAAIDAQAKAKTKAEYEGLKKKSGVR